MDIQYNVSPLDITEHVSFGAGVVFAKWPDEATILQVMEGIRQALKEHAQGDIFWHINKTNSGWSFSGNISKEVIKEPVEVSPLVLSGAAHAGMESVP